ncbi:MAG: MAPEG family protein [Sphingomicrobium sp.]|nr:MAPEG family protein [Sphingomonadales bacterium]
MAYDPLLGPVVALVAWTLVMLVWAVIVRMPALKKAGIDLKTRIGSRPGALDGVVDDQAQWKAHNYIHLVEQPTLFYAIVFALIFMGASYSINVWLAWAYVILRVLHSIVQALWNRIIVRFTLFALSTICLLGLTVHAAAHLIHA